MRRRAKRRTLAAPRAATGRPQAPPDPAVHSRAMSFSDALRVLSQDGAAIWGFLMAAALVLALTPLVARLAPHIGGIDDAKDRPRVHKQPIPRIGGLAIVAGILVPAAVFVGLEAQYLG